MPVYKRLMRDEEIGPDTALVQGALALDAAGVIAERQSDVEGLLNVAAMWMKLTDTIVSFSEHVEAQEARDPEKNGELVKSSGKIEMGFQKTVAEETIIVEEDDE